MATRTNAPEQQREASMPNLRFGLGEDSGSSGAEGRTRRKYQRAAADNERPVRKTSASIAVGKAAGVDSKPSFAARRRSTVRDHKAPLGPRPLDQAGGANKRVPSASLAPSTHALRSMQPSASEASMLPPAVSNNPRFSFGRQPQRMESGSTFDFLPSVNFDDFHESIRTPDPQLGDFPVPGASRGLLAADENQARAPSGFSSGRSSKQADSRAASSSSFSRRTSISQRRDDMDSSIMGPPAGSLSISSRRQSQFSGAMPITDSNSNPTSHSSRGPRKSLGPGFLDAQRSQQDAAASQREVSHGSIGRSATNANRNRRGNLQPSMSANDVPRLSTAARANKTKSLLQPSNKSFLTNPPPTSLTPDLQGSAGSARSPARNSGQRANTPSSAQNKRLSMHYNVGLGARTVSPTDARRLKRMSLAPNTPRTPPTPQPDAAQEAMPTTYSPAMVLRKSVTPSSARATPENGNRKSVQSGLSLSSSSSFSSLRQQNNLPSRSSQIISTSRLPTPKPRNVHSSAGPEAEEDVPPVPAIPKAYESPREQIDQPVYPVPQNATPQADELGSVSMIETTKDMNDMSSFDVGNNTEIPLTTTQRANASGKHRRGLTAGNGSGNKTPPPIQHIGRKNLQPLRLPPLNLLPLSAPTADRIASFPAPSAELDQRQTTPPPKRNNAKTPSTPMTASKATFFSSGSTDDELTSATQLRSASSHYQLRSDTSAYPPPPTAAMPIPQNGARSTTTPFASNSLPKGSGDFAHIRSKPSGEYKFPDRQTESSAPKLNGPRALNAQKESSSAHTSESAETEPETPSSGSSLRRKLSLSWKRGSSKSSHRTQASQSNITPQQASSAVAPQPPKHNDMPPPKLPASSTWSGAVPAKSPSPTAKLRSSLEAARRRKPSGPLFASDAESDRQNGEAQARLVAAPGNKNSSGPPPSQAERTPSGTGAPRSASTSVLNPMQRMLGAKNSISTLKSRNLDVNLDRDDLVADEEMKRLAAKRKDFEAAAKEVDELRRRARPQERVSPAHALQMVPLNIFERGEIIDYKEVYFCGTKNAKKHVGDLHSTTANFGYDDERGDYQIVLGDHLAYRYEVVDVLGKGSFGQVVRCVDHKTGALVAIKIIRNKKRFHQQALVEVNILQKLREWDPDNKHSMINFTQHFYFRGHLCISTELLGMNLYEFIKAHEFRGFSLKLIRRFAKQILSSLVLLKGKRVIHCDLKPENILLAHPLHSEIKVIDFGSSCFETEKVYTYIQSRFYRSPEVILGMSYGLPIDMWSLGCILAELLTGSPIFPGEDEREQLMCIMEIFGPPDKHLVEKSTRKQLFFDSKGKPRISVNTKGRRRRPSSKTLEQSLKCNDEAFLDFIARCLRWDPERRMKPEEAVQHEFITGVRRVNPRARAPLQTNGTSSPIKRFNTVSQTPGRTRPLPEPPATSFKNSAAMASREQVASNSPVKTAGRRHSTVSGLQTNGAVKRTSNPQTAGAGGAGSGLPRVAQRSVSGKPDLASAAAVASLVSRPGRQQGARSRD